MFRKITLPVLFIGITILVSTAILMSIMLERGAFVSQDSVRYLTSVTSSWPYQRWFIYVDYHPINDTFNLVQQVHHAPLLDIVYGIINISGVSLTANLILVATVCWIALLILIAQLTYRLSGSSMLAAFATLIAATTAAFLFLFQMVMSEILFLPLLLLLLVLLVDLPETHIPSWRFWAAVGVLAILPVTRYVGIFVIGSVVIWWVWWRLVQGKTTYLIRECAFWLLSIMPLVIWLVHNQLALAVGYSPIGHHLVSSSNGFVDGLRGLFREVPQLVLPAVQPVELWQMLGGATIAVYLLLFIGLAVVLWQAGVFRMRSWWRHPPRTPLLLIAAVYFGLYSVAQPFLSFTPMDTRDVTTLLVLLQPWIIAQLSSFPSHRVRVALGGFVAVNIALLAVVSVVAGSSIWQSQIAWPFVRTQLLAEQYPQIAAYVEEPQQDRMIITNAPHSLILYQQPVHDVLPWLIHGQCTSQLDTHVVILDVNHQADTFIQRVEEKCPDLERREVGTAVVYDLNSPMVQR